MFGLLVRSESLNSPGQIPSVPSKVTFHEFTEEEVKKSGVDKHEVAQKRNPFEQRSQRLQRSGSHTGALFDLTAAAGYAALRATPR